MEQDRASAELQGEGPVGEGSKFVTVYRGMAKDVTLSEFARPTRVIVAAASKNVDIDTAYVFSEADGGTRLVVTTDVKPKGLTSVFSPLLRMMVRREMAKKYVTVKQAIESQTDSDSA